MAIILTLYSRRAIVSCGIILLVPVVLFEPKDTAKNNYSSYLRPPGIALSILCIQTFITGDADMASAYRALSLTAYAEGLRYGYALVLRLWPALLGCCFLSMTTPLL